MQIHTNPRGTPDGLTSLVCPYDLQGFALPDSDVLRCPAGHSFPIIQGIPDLAIVEESAAYLHHRPDRGRFSSDSYDDRRRAGQPTISHPGLLNRVRALRRVIRSVRFYKYLVPLALSELEVETPENPPPPREDNFTEIFGPGLCAHELLKRLEKELFWDRLTFDRPAYEVGTSEGYASRYFFSGRTIDYGSEYLFDDLIASHLPHRFRFSANVKFLPFADESLNTVLCSQTVTCVYASIQSILAEINRVLRPGGRFLFTTHGPAYLCGLPPQGWPEMGLSARDCARRNDLRSHYMAHLYTHEEWRQILAASGFELTESRGILSLELARYSQLFYYPESSGPNVFRERYQRGRIGAVVRMLFGGERNYRDCQAKYREVMQRILTHELARNADAAFDDRSYLDAGIVAVKRYSVSPPIERLCPSLFPGRRHEQFQ